MFNQSDGHVYLLLEPLSPSVFEQIELNDVWFWKNLNHNNTSCDEDFDDYKKFFAYSVTDLEEYGKDLMNIEKAFNYGSYDYKEEHPDCWNTVTEAERMIESF